MTGQMIHWTQYPRWCSEVIDNAFYENCSESFLINEELKRLRAENKTLNAKLNNLAVAVGNMPTCKIACDGVLFVPVDRYNAAVEIANA